MNQPQHISAFLAAALGKSSLTPAIATSLRLIIAGGRDYLLCAVDFIQLETILQIYGISEVVSGGASGADTCGEKWAEAHKIPIKQFPADWNAHGKAAGPIRNRQMAEYANAVALFPGGRGTENMRKTAQELGLMLFDFTQPAPAIATALNPLAPCREHGLVATLGFDGTHFIECPKGCEMHCGENASPNELIQKWNGQNHPE